MAQHYSYVLLKELIWLLTEESHAEQFHQHFGYFWIKYYSLCSMYKYCSICNN